jgi:hypothetical protein
MAKQKISDAIQKQFEKPQFQLGTAVLFSWMGNKQVGYVKKIKQVSWGIQYMVESSTGVKYPCGIEIKGQKTHYNTGCIYFEDSRSIGQSDLIKRFQNQPKSRRTATISINTTGTVHESTDDHKLLRGNAAANLEKNTKSKRKGHAATDDSTLSSARNNSNHTKKRKVSRNAELDAAIQKQRSFLDFTKPMKKD